jgi:Flp pilus assembly protein TadB
MAVTDREEVRALREDAHRVRDTLRKDNLEDRLEGVVKERPGIQPFLEFRPLAVAVLIAAVLTLASLVLFNAGFAALVLVLSFAIAWIVMARKQYSERRPTKEYSPEDEDSPGKGDKEVAPYSG